MRFGIRRFQQAEAAAHQDDLTRGRRRRAFGKADAACRQDPLPDGMVHAYDQALISEGACKSDAAVSGGQHAQVAAPQGLAAAAQGGHHAVIGPQLLVLVPPRIADAAERILKALHPGLVAVVDARHTGQGKLQEGRHAQPHQGGLALHRRHAAVRPLVLRAAERLAQHGQDARRVMRAEVVHHAGEHLGRVILRQRHQAFAQRRAVIRSNK